MRPSIHTRLALLLFALLLAAGCASDSPSRGGVPPTGLRITPIEPRVDAVGGHPLVIPVRVDGGIPRARQVRARLDDGRHVRAELYWVGVAIPGAHGPASWLPPAGRWASTPAEADAIPSSVGSWTILADLPLDALGQGLWIERERVDLNWHSDPGTLWAFGRPLEWRSPVSSALVATTHLRALMEPERESPVRRWRWLLVTTGLAPPGALAKEEGRDVEPPAPAPFDDPVIEALAAQSEARWRVALVQTQLADAELATRLGLALAGVATFAEGLAAPAWPTDQASLDALLSDLLAPGLTLERRRARIEQWIERLPVATTWVIDDAGAGDPSSRRFLATAALANLSQRATLSWIAFAGSPPPDLLPTYAYSVAQHHIAPPADAPPIGLIAHAGDWERPLPVQMTPLAAEPPGFAAGPLSLPWTIDDWRAGEPAARPPAPEWTTGALVLRQAADASGDGAWAIHLDCRWAAPPVEGDPDDTVRVWLGPSADPITVLRITSGGTAIDEIGARQGRDDRLEGVTITSGAAGWQARVPIPPRAIEAGGILRLGIERTDFAGARTAWPRRMLPWQSEPGRVAIDLTTWRGFSSASDR